MGPAERPLVVKRRPAKRFYTYLLVKFNILMFSLLSSKRRLSSTVRQVLRSISHQPPDRLQFEGETSPQIFVNMNICHCYLLRLSVRSLFKDLLIKVDFGWILMKSGMADTHNPPLFICSNI